MLGSSPYLPKGHFSAAQGGRVSSPGNTGPPMDLGALFLSHFSRDTRVDIARCHLWLYVLATCLACFIRDIIQGRGCSIRTCTRAHHLH